MNRRCTWAGCSRRCGRPSWREFPARAFVVRFGPDDDYTLVVNQDWEAGDRLSEGVVRLSDVNVSTDPVTCRAYGVS